MIRDTLGLTSLAAARQAIAAYRPRDVIEAGYVESILCIRAVFRDACRRALDPRIDNTLAVQLQRGVSALAREMRCTLAALERRQSMPLPLQPGWATSPYNPNRVSPAPALAAPGSQVQPNPGATLPSGRPHHLLTGPASAAMPAGQPETGVPPVATTPGATTPVASTPGAARTDQAAWEQALRARGINPAPGDGADPAGKIGNA